MARRTTHTPSLSSPYRSEFNTRENLSPESCIILSRMNFFPPNGKRLFPQWRTPPCFEYRYAHQQPSRYRISYNVRENPYNVVQHFQQFLMEAQGVRRLGSAALDLCYVAAGRLDGYWEVTLQPWDKAAGIVIVQEAEAVSRTSLEIQPISTIQTRSPPTARSMNRCLRF